MNALLRLSILHRYLLRQFLATFALTLASLTTLFLVFDFFDRIDKFLSRDASFGLVSSYFLLKLPFFITVTLPLSALLGTILSFGMLSKNSEITAMRASGCKVSWLGLPLLAMAFVLSLLSLVINETILPYTQRRVREIYNIDVREKDKAGVYSQENLWWRSGKQFFSVDHFDSRTNSMLGVTRFQLRSDFQVLQRTDAENVTWVNDELGWTMHGVKVAEFRENGQIADSRSPSLPLPISETPRDFYDVEKDPSAMSYSELANFIDKREKAGILSRELYADLYGKLAFPFITFVVTLLALPFSLTPSRSGSMALSIIAGLAIGFTYYVIHSVSVAMGRAEVWNPIVAAWVANALMGGIGIILNMGAEAPA